MAQVMHAMSRGANDRELTIGSNTRLNAWGFVNSEIGGRSGMNY